MSEDKCPECESENIIMIGYRGLDLQFYCIDCGKLFYESDLND